MSKPKFREVLEKGQFAVTAELGPPRGADADVVRKKAGFLKGVDAVNVTDCQTAIVRMSSSASCFILKEMGIDPILQMTCRDRNRIGMQADLLGVAALGVQNVLCMTGDHPQFGDHPQARGVFDLDSVSLISMVRGMTDKGQLLSGGELKPAPDFFIGGVENPFAAPYDFRAARAQKKAKAGARFFQTQIVYNVERFKSFMAGLEELGVVEDVFVLAGVAPLKSAGMARYMKARVPGMDVTDEVLSRMEKASDPRQEGINICVEIIKQVKDIDGVRGVHVMAVEWEEAVPEILELAGLTDRN